MRGIQFRSSFYLNNSFDEDDPDTIILIRLLTWHIKFEKHKALKGYLRYKTITFQKVSSDAQANNFFIL